MGKHYLWHKLLKIQVHSVPIKPCHQKFLISSVYIQRAELWKDFDVDKHCRGAYAVWDLKEIKKVKVGLSSSKKICNQIWSINRI